LVAVSHQLITEILFGNFIERVENLSYRGGDWEVAAFLFSNNSVFKKKNVFLAVV
jgi:hypothetical protein